VVRVQLPGGMQELEIVEISYCAISLGHA